MERSIWRKAWNVKIFFNWLDTIIDNGNSDWYLVEDFGDGDVRIRFTNIEEEEGEEEWNYLKVYT